MTTTAENPFNITDAIDRVGAGNEGIYLTREQKYVLLDYITWHAVMSLLVQFTPYDAAKLLAQFGDGTNFHTEDDAGEIITALRQLRGHLVRWGANAGRPQDTYALNLLPAGRWATDLFVWMAPQDDEYGPRETVGDVLAMSAAIARITPGGLPVLDRVRAEALAAARIVHAR